MLDSYLAKIYAYKTKKLNRQEKNNIEIFTKEFMFQLNEYEMNNLR